MLPEEEEEDRREEIGGLELFGELYDSLVVAGTTAGSSLSMAPLRLLWASLRARSSWPAGLRILICTFVICEAPNS